MGKSQRDKGYRTENNVRLKALEHGLDAYRVPLSGGASIKGDVVVKNSVDEWVLEIKCRATASNKSTDGWKTTTRLFSKQTTSRSWSSCLWLTFLIC